MLREAVEHWNRQKDSGTLISLRNDGQLTLYDTRSSARRREIVLEGMAKTIYDYCDEGRLLRAILRHLERIGGHDAADVQSVLDSLVEARVMLHADDRYLSLAIHTDERAREFTDSFVEALIVPKPALGSESGRRHG